MSGEINSRDLDSVFGSTSKGATPEERAKNSLKLFVRSQDSIACSQQGAEGLVMNAQTALENYGFNTLLEVIHCGSAILVCSEDEPSRSIRLRREQLQLTQKQLAEMAGVTDAIVICAEDPGFCSSIHQLAKICHVLGLDVYQLGFLPFEELTIQEK